MSLGAAAPKTGGPIPWQIVKGLVAIYASKVLLHNFTPKAVQVSLHALFHWFETSYNVLLLYWISRICSFLRERGLRLKGLCSPVFKFGGSSPPATPMPPPPWSLFFHYVTALLFQVSPGHLPDQTGPLSANVPPPMIQQANVLILLAEKREARTKTWARAVIEPPIPRMREQRSNIFCSRCPILSVHFSPQWRR